MPNEPLSSPTGIHLSLGHQQKSVLTVSRQAAVAAKVSPMRTFAAIIDSRVISAVESASTR